MSLEEVIINRRAVYPDMFSGEKVDDELIDKMLELANWAPTHKKTEPWRFKVYSGESKNKLLDFSKEHYIKSTPAEKFRPIKLDKMEERKQQASHIIAICMKRNADLLPEFEEIASVAMAVQNMWLYLSSVDQVGGYWSTPEYALSEEFKAFISLTEDEKCLGVFYVGKVKREVVLHSGRRGEWKEKVVFHK